LGFSNKIGRELSAYCIISGNSTSVIIVGIEEMYSKSRVNKELSMTYFIEEGLVFIFSNLQP